MNFLLIYPYRKIIDKFNCNEYLSVRKILQDKNIQEVKIVKCITNKRCKTHTYNKYPDNRPKDL